MMGDQLPLICTFALTLAIFITVSANLILRKSRGKNDPLLPPGPPRLPLLGNLHQLIIGGALPHHTIYKLSEKYGPIMRLHLGECPAFVVSSPELAKEVLRTKELSFPQRPEFLAVEVMSYDHSSFIFAPYGDYWRRIRKICVSELLSTTRVNRFRSIREEEVWDLVAAVSSSAGDVVNLSRLIFLATNNVTSRAMFGMRCADSGEFLTLLKQLNEVGVGFNLPDLFPSLKFLLRHVSGMQSQLQRILSRIDRILDDILNHHQHRLDRVDGQTDVLDVLIKLQASADVDFNLTADQIKVITLELFSGGSETSAAAMEWAMAELMKNPPAMAKVQAELRQAFQGKSKIDETDIHQHDLPYLRAIIKETLRLHPPGPLIARQSIQPCEVGGYQIPPNAKILVNAYAIGRDPNIWSEPDRFWPERFIGSTVDFAGSNFELIPFGGGRRICPGISFATALSELALAQILYHFDWSLPQGMRAAELDMSEIFGITVRKMNTLNFVPTLSIP